MPDQDPVESDEATAECWAAENVDGDRFKCQCGEWKPLAGSSPSGPSPYAIPVCGECAMLPSERKLWLTADELHALGNGMGPTGRGAARMLERWREVDPKIGLTGMESPGGKETYRIAGRTMILAGRTAELRTAMIYWAIIAFEAHISAIASGKKKDFDTEMVHVNAANAKITAIDTLLETKMDLLEKQLQPEATDG